MEGSYNKVWHGRGDVPAEEYVLFMDILMETIRHEIASCSEAAYTGLPLDDAARLFFFNSPADFIQFAQQVWVSY